MPSETGLSGASGASGGGGGGDASAANQVLGLTALDQIYDALVLVGTEATSADILAAVQGLSAGATLDDLAAALAPLATEATQQDVLAALEAQAIDVGLIQTNVALLVPDVDSMKDSLASIDGKIPASPAQDRTTFGAPSAVRIANAGASAFITPFIAGDNVLADLRVGGVAVGAGNPIPVSGTVTATVSGVATETTLSALNGKFAAAATHSEGAAQTSTTQIRAVLTVIQPSAWGGANTLSAPAGNLRGLAVQGYVAAGSAVDTSVRPLDTGLSDGTNIVRMRGDSSGRPSITNNRIARTAHLASATLPAAGAYTSQTAYTVPEGVVSITAYVVYTRGAAGGQVVLRPQWSNGTETAYETAVSASSATGGTLCNQIELREILGPVVKTASAVTFAISFDVPAGATTFNLLAAEAGVTGTPGTCAITLTARYGT